VEAFAKDIAHVALRRADTHNEQYRTMMGTNDPNLITPRAKEGAYKLGDNLGQEVERFGSGGQIGQKQTPAQGATPPANPTDGQLWETRGAKYKFSTSRQQWVKQK